ncbi:MAG: hypothetical protein O2U61_04160 [Candidatus Bathyarchaeota archaeon]|nr:hypothetical protein [Candidatus Bathyarchaeota archaeon]
MFGVNAANAAVTQLAKTAAVKVEKDIARRALTKGRILVPDSQYFKASPYRGSGAFFSKSD